DVLVTALHRLGILGITKRIARSYHLQSRNLTGVAFPRFAILCYHRVGLGGVPIYSELRTSLFEAQMRFLRKNYRLVSMQELILELLEGATTEPAVAVTFDDGYRDLYSEAFPILAKYQIPATIYLTVGSIDTGEVAWYDRIFLALQVVPG